MAKHAGVSKAAVSKVIRNDYGVSQAMRDRVKRAIDELGYRPQAAARALRGRAFTIGVLMQHIGIPFYAEIVTGLVDELAESEYQAIMIQGGTRDKTEKRAIDALIDRQVDGILMIAPLAARTHLEQVAREIPTLVLGRHDRSPAYDSIVDDDRVGSELVMEHLIGLGHRRIGHITFHKEHGQAADRTPQIRAETYERVMREHNLAGEIAVATTSYTEEGGYDGARELLGRSPRPTAIFAGSDEAALGVLAALHEAGLSVPGDVSVAGYDNTKLAAHPNIALTTVNQDGVVMGRTAGRLLLERIEGRTSAAHFSVIPSLVVRRSTASPRPCPAETETQMPARTVRDVTAADAARRRG
ncbi:LacI family DNA-binding transcriptional regulator [Nonomuraea sp. 3N208]|uniref:LacI family DNA-binding transcriptional regulator n=1 Tax=Nonomuraea sp. 3N208 TaxID=3457421 RepID=UPI003FD5F0B5